MSLPGVVDVHVHLTRDARQERVVFPRAGVPDAWLWANGERVTEHLDREGVRAVVAVNFMEIHRMLESRLAREPRANEAGIRAELEERLRRFNQWTCEFSRQEPRVIPFAGIDAGVFPKSDQIMEELEARLAQGARGVKIHPGLSRFRPDDPRMFPLYERCQEAGAVVLSDTGALTTAPDGTVLGEPVHFMPVFETFPRLHFIMAHMPGAYWDQRIAIAQRFPQVLFDTAGGFNENGFSARDGRRACAIEDGARLIRQIGAERVLFGSDAPSGDQRAQIRQILQLQLSDREKEAVLSGNAAALFGLDAAGTAGAA